MKRLLQKELQFILAMLLITVIISGYEIKLLQTYLLVEKMVSEDINYDTFRKFQISEGTLMKATEKAEHLCENYPQLKELIFVDKIGFLAFSMMARDYDLTEYPLVDEQTFLRGIAKVAATDTFQELYGYYRAIITDLVYFPVPEVDKADVTYSDSWNMLRTYGGNRSHEGTDLMASNNLRGFFPVISITDGTVEKMGWLEQGGYRIGIRSTSGGYFYYAHLYSYAPELGIKDSVIAGQLLGFMGDSGYGSEGTIGQFPVHLHLGIYVNSKVEEMSINPYWVLQILEKNRTKYNY